MSPAAETLSNRTARAAHWRFAGTVISGTSHLVVAVFLARLLSPAEFGIVALAQFALGLAQTVCDLGIGAAVVQRSQLSERHVRVAVTSSGLVGLAAAAIVAGGAGVGAAVMREPGVAPVLRVLALGLAFRSVAVVADALLRRQLDFRRLFFIETASFVFGYGCVAITLAALDSGVWSLVWASVAQTALASGAQWASVRHSVRPLLARRELAELLRFGVGSALARLANYFALNGDSLVVGRWMGAANLGLYDRAYILMNLPNTYVAAVISSALFPALSQVQEQPSLLRRGYFLTTRVTAMIAGPAMATVIVGAPYLVSSLYGHQWTAMVIPLQILCLAGYFRALYHLGGAVAQSVGRVSQRILATDCLRRSRHRRRAGRSSFWPAGRVGRSRRRNRVHVRRNRSARAAGHRRRVDPLLARATPRSRGIRDDGRTGTERQASTRVSGNPCWNHHAGHSCGRRRSMEPGTSLGTVGAGAGGGSDAVTIVVLAARWRSTAVPPARTTTVNHAAVWKSARPAGALRRIESRQGATEPNRMGDESAGGVQQQSDSFHG